MTREMDREDNRKLIGSISQGSRKDIGKEEAEKRPGEKLGMGELV